MLNRPLSFAVVAVAAVGVAGGAYFAARQSAPEPIPIETPAVTTDASSVDSSPIVTETEATIAPEPQVPDISTKPADALASSIRAQAESARSERAARRVRTTGRPAPAPTPEPRPSPPRAADAPAPPPPAPPQPAPSGLDRAWPSRDPEPEPVAETASAAGVPIGSPEEPPPQRLVPEPPPPMFEELVVPADAVIGLQIDTAVSSEQAQVEDLVEARVTRDVTSGERVAIPAGTRVQGSVVQVDRGGKLKERARLGIRFHTIALADGTLVPVRTETVFREGTSPARGSTAKIGGAAVGGAILGAIFGGTKGAVIGGSAGAAGGTAAVMAGARSALEFPAGSTVTVRLSEPVTITVEPELD